MALNLNDRVFDCLKARKEERFTASEVAHLVFETFPAECKENREGRKKIYKTDGEYISQLAAQIGAHWKDLQEIKIAAGPPRKFYYTEKSESDEVQEAEISPVQPFPGKANLKLSEFDLYPILYRYLGQLGVNARRINEKLSLNNVGKNWNKWLHPDLVGFEALDSKWKKEIQACVKESKSRRARLWSFEVKLLINSSNVRESFFQAVSNSSWANFGYLVASEIEERAKEELQTLCAAHGIGFIKLDTENESDSNVVLPARERSEVDWDSANRLAVVNPDFKEFLELLRQFYLTGVVKKSDWPEPTADGKG